MAEYFYQSGTQVRGPFSLADCFLLIDDGTINFETQVSGCSESWSPLATYPELAGHRARNSRKAASGPSALTICAGILMAVFILGAGGLMVAGYQQAEKRKLANQTRIIMEAEELAEAQKRAAQKEIDTAYYDATKVIHAQLEKSSALAGNFSRLGDDYSGITRLAPAAWDVWGRVTVTTFSGEKIFQPWEVIFPHDGLPAYTRLGDSQIGDKQEALGKLSVVRN